MLARQDQCFRLFLSAMFSTLFPFHQTVHMSVQTSLMQAPFPLPRPPVLGCVLLSQCDSVALSRQMQASVSEKAEHHVEICCSCIRKFPKRCRKKFSTEAAKPIYRNLRKKHENFGTCFFCWSEKNLRKSFR